MAKDPGKDLGYHWRRSAGVYNDPNRPKDQPKGNANTTTSDLGGLTHASQATAEQKKQ